MVDSGLLFLLPRLSITVTHRYNHWKAHCQQLSAVCVCHLTYCCTKDFFCHAHYFVIVVEAKQPAGQILLYCHRPANPTLSLVLRWVWALSTTAESSLHFTFILQGETNIRSQCYTSFIFVRSESGPTTNNKQTPDSTTINNNRYINNHSLLCACACVYSCAK